MIKIQRIFDLLEYAADSYGDQIAIGGKTRGIWKTYTYNEYKKIVDALSLGLLELGFQPGDKIATISNNRPEWNFMDMAIMQIGAVHVPISPTFSTSDLSYIIEHSEAKAIFTSSKSILNSFNSKKEKFKKLEECLSINKIHKIIKTVDFENIGKLNNIKNGITENEVACILYTSGTYDKPMGVLTSHKASNVITTSYAEDYGYQETDIAISYLPVTHAYEKAHHLMYLYSGVSVYYAESICSVVTNLQEIKPTVFTTVPALIEKLFQSFSSSSNTENIDRTIEKAYEYDPNDPKKIKFENKDRQVFERFKRLIGGRVRLISSAGAPLPRHFANALWAMGIPMLEVYGMTECCGICNNGIDRGVMTGTVGPPSRYTQLKLSEEGEVLIKGPNLMNGYYKDPKANERAFDKDGWFHTNDIGEWVDNKFIRLLGRKNDIFKLSSGEFIIPTKIEATLNKSSLINSCMLFEENQRPTLLVVPNLSEKQEGAKLSRDILEQNIWNDVNKLYNDKVVESKRIRNVYFDTKQWTVEDGELTPTMKIKRKNVLEQYRKRTGSYK